MKGVGDLNTSEIRSLKPFGEWGEMEKAQFLVQREIAAQLAELNETVSRVFAINKFTPPETPAARSASPETSSTPTREAGPPAGAVNRQPERTPQTVESARMSTGKYDREAVEQITLTPTRIERKEGANGPYLQVMWPARGRGFLSASCFDEKLFAWVSGRGIKQETVFYTVHSGKYTNIVGVRA